MDGSLMEIVDEDEDEYIEEECYDEDGSMMRIVDSWNGCPWCCHKDIEWDHIDYLNHIRYDCEAYTFCTNFKHNEEYSEKDNTPITDELRGESWQTYFNNDIQRKCKNCTNTIIPFTVKGIYIDKKLTPVCKVCHKDSKNKSHRLRKSQIKQMWEDFFGTDNLTQKCWCCREQDITPFSNYECGHFIAKSNNGPTIIENLRPICGTCNKNMGTECIGNWIHKNKFWLNSHDYIKPEDRKFIDNCFKKILD